MRGRLRWLASTAAVLAVFAGALAEAPAASATTPTITLTSSAATVAPASTIDLTASAPIAQAGATTQEIVQTIDPAKVKLTAVSDITYPSGWTLSYCSGAATDCTVAANFSATTPANATAWAAVKAVKASGSIDSQGESGGYQLAAGTSSGTGVRQTPATISASGSGDGYQAFFDPGHTRVFNVYHHNTSTSQIDCHVILTGATCTGFPFNLAIPKTGQYSTGRVVGTKIWIPAYKSGATTAQDAVGFVCLNIASVLSAGTAPSLCSTSWVPLATGMDVNSPTTSRSSNAGLYDIRSLDGVSTGGSSVDAKLWSMVVGSGKLICLDTATAAACSGMPTNGWLTAVKGWKLDSSTEGGNTTSLVVADGRIYLEGSDSASPSTVGNLTVACVLVSNPATECPGFTGGKNLGRANTNIAGGANSSAYGALRVGNLVEIPASDGTSRGVCLLGDTRGLAYYDINEVRPASSTTAVPCWDASGTSFTGPATLSTVVTSAFSWGFVEYQQPLRMGKRIFWGNGVNFTGDANYPPRAFCWDASVSSGTGGPCASMPSTGYVTDNYTVTPDPVIADCMWVTRHTQPNLRTYNMVDNVASCASVAPSTVSFSGSSIVPRMACTSNPNAIRAWQSFTLTSVTGTSDYTATLTVKDSSGSVINGWSNLAITGGAALDLSSLSPATTGLTPSFDVTIVPNSGSPTAATAKVIVVGDAPQLCAHLTGVPPCPVTLGPVDSGALAPATATLTGSGSSTAGGVTTSFASSSTSVTVTVATSAQCGSTLTGRAGDATLGTGGTAVVGVTVSLLNSSGVAITYPSDYSTVALRGLPVTATTDASGNYSFGYLTPGSYKVSFPTSGTYTSSSATVASGAAGSSLTTANAVSGTSTSAVDALVVGTNGVVNGLYVIAAAATADTSTGKAGVAQTISPLTNDTASSGASYSGGSTALKLCGAAQTYPSCTATSLVVSGQGSYAVSGTTVTFTPCTGVNTPVMSPACTGAFTGTATAVTYQSTDSLGRTATSTITPTVVPAPVASNDTSTGVLNAVQSISPLANDTVGSGTTFSNATLKICTSGTANASCTGTTLNVAGQGTYTVNGDGTVSFAPCQATGSSGASCTGPFAGTATAIKYVISDALGQQTNALITPTVTTPAVDVASPDTTSGLVGVAQTVNPLANDTAPTGVTLQATSVKLCTSGQSPPSCTGTSLVVAGSGVYTVNTGTGALTFTPCNAVAGNLTVSGTSYATGCTGTPFSGTPTAATYQVSDNLAPSARTVSSTYTPTVIGTPAIIADTSSGAFGATQTISVLANDAAGTGATLTASSVRICATGTVAASCTGTSLVSSGKGIFTANSDGTVSFAPCTASGVPAGASCTAPFYGAVPAIEYRVTDSVSQMGTSTITVTVNPPAADAANPDTSSGLAGVTQSVDPLSNDTAPSGVSLVATSVKLCTGSQSAPNCTGTSLTNAQGTYTVNPTTGVISFAPCTAAGVPNGSCTGPYTGTATPVTYQVSDNLSTPRTVSSTYTPTVVAAPTATNDTSTGAFGATQTISVLSNDTADASTALSPSSVKLCTGVQVSPNCTGTTLTNAEGTYTVNANGTVAFAPCTAAGVPNGSCTGPYYGTATPVNYQVSDGLGQTATATITPTVNAPTPPTAAAGTATLKPNGTVNFTSILGTGGLATPGTGTLASAYLCNPNSTPAQTVPNCTATSVTIAGAGTYTINPSTGVVTFTDSTGTAGAKTAISYQVNDSFAQTAGSTLTPTVTPGPSASNDASRGEQGFDQTISPLGNDSVGAATSPLDPSTVRLCLSGQTPTSCTGTSSVPAMSGGSQVGTFTVNANGTVTFHPSSPTWNGAVDPITYQVADSTGQSTSATIAVRVLPPPAPSGVNDAASANFGSTVSFTPLSNDSAGTAPANVVVGPSISGTVTTVTTTSWVNIQSDPATVKLCGPGESVPGCTQTTVSTADGTYVLSGSTVTFTGCASSGSPAQTPACAGPFLGTATQPVTYQFANAFTIRDTTVDTTTDVMTGGGAGYAPANDANNVAPGNPGYIPTWSKTTVVDTAGTPAVASATITPTITRVGPTATNDTATALINRPVTITPLANDTAGSFTLNASSIRLCDTTATPAQSPTPSPGTCNATSVTIAGKGTFALDGPSGSLVFTPISGWTGTTPALPYVVADAQGYVANATVTVTVNAPTAVNDSSYGLAGNNQTIDVLANDAPAAGTGTTLNATTVKLCDVGESVPLCSKTSLTTADGTYTVNATTGVVTFAPAAGFTTGAATAPVTYQVSDSQGSVATATITPHVVPPPTPTAANDTGYAPSGQNVVFTPSANDSAGSASSPTSDITFSALALVPTSVKLCAGGENPPACTATTLTTADGTYTVNGSGTVTFVPASGFSGTALYPVTYQISNTYSVTDHGVTTSGLSQTASATLTPVVVPPPTASATADTGSAAYGQTVTFTPWSNDSPAATTTSGSVTYTNTGAQNGFTGASVRLCGSGELPPACTATTLTTVDGTYVVNAGGTVTFTPATGFSGTATVPPTYQITSPFSVANSSPTYSGTDSSIVSAQLIPTINPLVSPVAQADSASGLQGAAVAMVLTTNDSSASVAASSTYPIDVTTVRLCGLTETAPACTVTSAGSVVKSGQGVFTITNAATGEVTFTPCRASGVPDASCTGVWTGVADVDYIVTDTHGNSATSTYTVTINPLVLPTATNDTSTTPYNTAKTVSVAANDTDGTYALAPTSVLLCGPTETAPACTQTSVSNGTGTFTVNASGTVTYTPASGFSGPAAITYSIADTHGNRVDALLSITVDAPTVTPRDNSADPAPTPPATPTCRSCAAPASTVTPDAAPAPAPSVKPASAVIPPPPPTPSSPDGPKAAPHQRALVVNPTSPAVIDPLANARPSSGERLVPLSARLWNGTTWVASIDQPGVGTWRLRLGLVVFTPARGYIGTVRCYFKISDTAGRSAVNRIDVVIRPQSGDVPSAIIAGRAQAVPFVH